MAKELVNQMKGQATEGKIFASYKLADRQYLEYTLNFLKINKNKKTIQSKHGYRSDKILQRRNGSHHLESSTTTRLHWLHFGPVRAAMIQRTNTGAGREESTHSLLTAA